MKRMYLIIAMMSAMLTTNAQASLERRMEYDIPAVEITADLLDAKDYESLADALGEIKGIESVYISKSMLALAGSMGGKLPLSKGDFDKLDCIYIFNAESKTGQSQKVKTVAGNYMKSHKYEKLMEQKLDDEMMSIHVKENGGGIREYVLLTCERDEASVIIMVGNIKSDDFLKNIK